MLKKETQRPLLLVEWIDSHGGGTWTSLAELESDFATPCKCRTVGWLVAEKNGVIVLAASLSGESDPGIKLSGNGHMTIPKVAITKRTILRVGR